MGWLLTLATSECLIQLGEAEQDILQDLHHLVGTQGLLAYGRMSVEGVHDRHLAHLGEVGGIRQLFLGVILAHLFSDKTDADQVRGQEPSQGRKTNQLRSCSNFNSRIKEKRLVNSRDVEVRKHNILWLLLRQEKL